MKGEWLDREAVLAVTGWKRRTFEMKVQAGDIEFRESKQRAANGRTIKEYSVLSLPADAQKKTLSLALKKAATLTLPPRDSQQHSLPLLFQESTSPADLILLSAAQQKEADRRY